MEIIPDKKNIPNEYSISQLNYIKDLIEKMNHYHQLKILKILNDDGVILNENQNGNYVNLTELDSSIMSKITNYVLYAQNQETILESGEKKMNEYKKLFSL